MAEADIATLCCEGIAVDDNKNPAPENAMQSGDVLTTPSSLPFGFNGVDTWLQSRNFLVGRAKLEMIPNPRIQHMYRLYFFIELCFIEYIKDVVIPENNKHLNSDMNLSEYFCVIGCHLIMACYVGHSVRDLFLKDPIIP